MNSFRNTLGVHCGLMLLAFFATAQPGMAQPHDPSAIDLPENAPAQAALQQLLRSLDQADRQIQQRQIAVGSVHRVRRGETLDMIIARSFGDTPIRRSVLRSAFVSANPHAFRRGNPHFMFADVDLRIPGVDEFSGVILTDEGRRQMQREQTPSRQDRSRWIRYP